MSRFFHLLERYPPVLVRLLARRNRLTITTERIASDMSVTPMFVLQIASRHNWRGLSIDNFMGFTGACNLDLTRTGDVNRVETGSLVVARGTSQFYGVSACSSSGTFHFSSTE